MSKKRNTLITLFALACFAVGAGVYVTVFHQPKQSKTVSSQTLNVIDKPRPFISAPEFFGPDRRRKVEKFTGEDRRTAKPGEIEEEHEQLQ